MALAVGFLGFPTHQTCVDMDLPELLPVTHRP